TRSDNEGKYQFVGLQVGTYEIRVEVTGFSAYSRTVNIPLGQTVRFDVTLSPADVNESVTVKEESLPLDPSVTAVTTSIDPERIEELPVSSRNYLEFTLTAPGVAPSSSVAGNGGQSMSAIPDSGFTFGGLRPRSNSISIDGLDNTDETTG